MPSYNYICESCKISNLIDSKINKEFIIYVNPECDNPLLEPLIWSEFHKMSETPEIKCPVCEKISSKTFMGVHITSYVRGNCYFDKVGARRDMELHTLENHDPYDYLRQSGEADEMKSKMRKAGKKHVPKEKLAKIKSNPGEIVFNPNCDKFPLK